MPSAPVKKLRQEKIKCSKIALVFVRGVDGRTPKRIPTLQFGQNSPRIPSEWPKEFQSYNPVKILQEFCQDSSRIPSGVQRYTYRVLQTIQMKLILLCVWPEPAVLGSSKTTLKFKDEI